jgi:hypothetical protein
MAVASLEDADADTRVRVICRVRPRAPSEVGDGQYAECVQVESAESFVRVTKNAWDRPEAFAFDAVLPVNASQRRVYDAVCLPVVEAVLGGANGAVLAYGMTGSGKTYSLMHVGSKPASSTCGLFPHTAEEVFAPAPAEGPNVETRLAVGFVQIYNEEVYDLLVDETERPGGTTTPLRLVDRAGAAHCEGASARVARNADDVLALLAAGRRRRKEANLKLNASSSRSHAIITFHVSRSFGVSDVGRGVAGAPRERRFTSKLSFADLAGSERVRRTGASGARLTEAGFINKSLAALGNCVHILAERGSRDDVGHVPYRDSKLTRLLRDCFGNGCRTSLLVTCSPDPTHAGETTTTLRFGQRAMRVETVVKTQRVAEYRAAVKRQASEVDRLQASLEDALALARNAKAEAAAELERERRKIVAEAERERERRVAVARERLEEDAEAKARAMVRTVTQKVASMLDLERGRMTEAMASERAAADASEAKVAAETKASPSRSPRLPRRSTRRSSGSRRRRRGWRRARQTHAKPRREPRKPSRWSISSPRVFQSTPRKSRKPKPKPKTTETTKKTKTTETPTPRMTRRGFGRARWRAPSRTPATQAARRALRRRARWRRSRLIRADTSSWRRNAPCDRSRRSSATRAPTRARGARRRGSSPTSPPAPSAMRRFSTSQRSCPFCSGSCETRAKAKTKTKTKTKTKRKSSERRHGSSRRARWRT